MKEILREALEHHGYGPEDATTTRGPHKDDLRFLVNGVNARSSVRVSREPALYL